MKLFKLVFLEMNSNASWKLSDACLKFAKPKTDSNWFRIIFKLNNNLYIIWKQLKSSIETMRPKMEQMHRAEFNLYTLFSLELLVCHKNTMVITKAEEAQTHTMIGIQFTNSLRNYCIFMKRRIQYDFVRCVLLNTWLHYILLNNALNEIVSKCISVP